MIECNPYINFGQPALKGRRLTVFNIVTKLYYEESVKIGLEELQISIEEAENALLYCKNTNCREDKQLVNFCDGCLLRTTSEGWNFDSSNFIEMKDEKGVSFTVSKDNLEFFLGNLKDLENKEFGLVTWLLAEKVIERFYSSH